MSEFGNRLQEMMLAKGLTGVELARAAGVSTGHISKLCNGVQRWISPEDFEKIASAITTDKVEQAALLKAHLLDECKGPGSELISITVKNEPEMMLDESPTYSTALPPKTQKAIQIIVKEAEFDKDIRDNLESLARLIAPDNQS